MNQVLRRRRVAWALGVISASALLAGCAGASGTSSGKRLSVVAAENFYGNLVSQIGGRHVEVTSVLSNPDADPHLFEPGSRTGLSVATARVVIQNGAGYDDWMTKLLSAAPDSGRQVVTIADALHVTGSDPNPHLWYDTPALPQIVTAIGNGLIAADPANATDYRAGINRTLTGLRPLQQAVSQLGIRDAGAPGAYTERGPGLLLAAAKLRVLTPPSFARAIEDGTDPTPSDVATMQNLLTAHRVRALLYNEQATSPLTARLQRVAKAAGVPIVPVTETEPAGVDFAGWQLGQVRALTTALGS